MQETDLAWLGGIWDGEGSILLYSRPVNDKRIQITPCVTMENTDIAIVNKARKVLDEIGCNFAYREYAPKNVKHKRRHRLSSQHAKNIKIFLEHTLPYLHSVKKHYGETLLAFVSRRLEKSETSGKVLKHLPYDEEDYEFIRSSTTTRETSC